MLLNEIFKPVKCMDIDANKPVETTMFNEVMRCYMIPFTMMHWNAFDLKPTKTKSNK